MKWDREKAIHQESVGEIQQIQVEMVVLVPLHPNISKDIHNLTVRLEQD